MTAKAKIKTLRFPVGGLVRRHAFQTQPPYTTPRALNVWPVGPEDWRQRGGRRAGLEKCCTGSAGATKFRALVPVPKASDTTYEYRLMCAAGNKWYYPVSGGAMTEWATGTLTSTAGRVPWVVRNSKVYYLDSGTLKVMDPYAPSLDTVVATAGSIPSSCDILRKYRDRLVMAKKRTQLWYMSRQSDYEDWDYTADSDDTQRALWASSTDLGTIQEPINAVAPWHDDYCVFGMDNSIWILRGDPAYGGQMNILSDEVGIISDDAWAYTPEGDLMFLDWSGLFLMPRGGGEIVPFSREKLPKDLWHVNPGSYDAVLRYDPPHCGFLLAITPVTGASEADPGEHWWIDWPTKSIWQLEFPWAKSPRFFEQFAFTAGSDHVLGLGCEDGVLRQFDDDGTDDDGTAIEAYCDIGPFRVGGNDYQTGILRELIGTLGKNSDDCTWKLFLEDTAEDCATATTATQTGTWSGGRNRSKYPRRRGGAGLLQLYGAGLWEFESAVAVIQAAGKQRM